MRIPDATLNFWADEYVARNLRDHDVSLEQFLAQPLQVLARVERRCAARSQVAAFRRHPALDPREADDPATEVRGGRLVEKLRHSPAKSTPTPFARRLFHRFFRSAR